MEFQRDDSGHLKLSLGLAEKWISGFIGAVVLTFCIWAAATLQTMTVKVAVMSAQMESLKVSLDVVPRLSQEIANLQLRTTMTESSIKENENKAAGLETRVNTLERLTPRN